jgi:CheY-like chemotaxis protein
MRPDNRGSADGLRGPGKPAILVVDDDPDLLRLLDEQLSDSGFRVVTAVDGADGAAKFERQPFDLLLTDLAMPKLNGMQLARKCKNLKPQVPVVLLTAWDLLVDDEERAEHGIDRVIAKPAKSAELVRVLQELTAPPAVRVGATVVD